MSDTCRLFPPFGEPWPSCLLPSQLLWPKLPELCWIVVVKVDIHVLFLTLGEMAFNFSPLRIMFAVGLSYIAFIMLRYVASIPAFWRFFSFFNHRWMLNFVKGFLWIYWDIHMFFFFYLLMRCVTLICRYWKILASLG